MVLAGDQHITQGQDIPRIRRPDARFLERHGRNLLAHPGRCSEPQPVQDGILPTRHLRIFPGHPADNAAGHAL